ncbi:hypothetical protein BC628DRAFT_1342519 [Trametes gibbosa]|nr:hypothetical protein BC628DRAFT_1342519 [Trametes gibbosa]
MLFSAASVVAGLAATAVAQDTFTMNTPDSATQCETTVVTWNGGVAPFNLSIVFDRTAEHFNGLTERTFSWNTDILANNVVFFEGIDATDHVAQSSLILVQPSTGVDVYY